MVGKGVSTPNTLTMTFATSAARDGYGLAVGSTFQVISVATGTIPATTTVYTVSSLTAGGTLLVGTNSSATAFTSNSGTNMTITANTWSVTAAGVMTLTFASQAARDGFNYATGDTFTMTASIGTLPVANTIYTVTSQSSASPWTIVASSPVTTAASGAAPIPSPAFRMTLNQVSSTAGSYTVSGAGITSGGISGQSTTTPSVFFAKFSTTTMTAGLNGVLVSPSTVVTLPATAYSFGNLRVFSGSSCRGKINEILVFNSTTDLTTQQRQQVEAYLAWKWGGQTLLPNTHPYYNLRA